ncbi:unnamed protein product [Linum tenue]|uniref:CCHC-type domain-containing protein n=1 Tax=Linum tenue TaxID=586396 RepID=A0AAV0IS48_9ROSI|nr:unnamed protein product [Linum tenue]
MDLDNDVFLVSFDNDNYYFKALTGGPWTILDHYLVVHQWTPAFRVGEQTPRTVTAWVQFPRLPIQFYNREVFFPLGNLLGRTIKLDYHTENGVRGKFARIAIELDLTKPLRPRIRLDGFWQKVVYENLPNACFECGIIGHTDSSCPQLHQATVSSTAATPGQPDVGPLPAMADSDTPAGFGPWMQVTRKSRKSDRKIPAQQANNQAHFQEAKIGKQIQGRKDVGDLPTGTGKNLSTNGKGKSNVHQSGGMAPKKEDQKSKAKNQGGTSSSSTAQQERERKKNSGGQSTLADLMDKLGGPSNVSPNGDSPKFDGKGILGPSPTSSQTPLSQTPPTPDLNADPINQATMGNSRTVFVPNGELVTITDVSCPEPPPPRATDPDIPLSSLRIKNGQKKTPRPTKSGIPINNTAKPLHIWSPKKEKKIKNREKLVTLTLQEIEACSSAARKQTSDVSSSVAAQASMDTTEL